MPSTIRQLRVFLCHASQDKSIVRELQQRFADEGWVDPWLDEKKLHPGEDWRMSIEEAVESSDLVVICLSNNSVDKEGFVQKELRYAREIALEKPEGTIFLIPLRLENCDVPRGLRFFQWADYFGEKKEQNYRELLDSFSIRRQQIVRREQEKTLRDIEDKEKREKEEKARREVEELAKREAEELARRRVLEIAIKEEEERAHLLALEKAKKEAFEKALEAAREKARLEAEVYSQKEFKEKKYKESRNNFIPYSFIAIGIIVLLFVGLVIGIGLVGLGQMGIGPFAQVASPINTQSGNTETVQPESLPTGESTVNDGLLGEIISRGFILISTDPNYAPQSFLNTSGHRPVDTKCPSDTLTTVEMQGFDVDVSRKIGDAIGVETCFVTPSWDAVTAGNWNDKWDISVGSMAITVERQKILNFSVPYYYTPAVIAVGKDSGITSIEQLAGKNLCAAAFTTYEAWINNDTTALGLPESSIYIKPPAGVKAVTRDNDQECAQAIAVGRTDFAGYVTSSVVVDYNIAEGLPVMKLGNPVFSENYAVAIDKAATLNSSSLLTLIDNAITAMHNDGTLSTLSMKWFEQDVTEK